MLEIGEVKLTMDMSEIKGEIENLQHIAKDAKQEVEALWEQVNCLKYEKAELEDAIERTKKANDMLRDALKRAKYEAPGNTIPLKQATGEDITIKHEDDFNIEFGYGFFGQIKIKKLGLNMKCDKFKAYYDAFKKKRIVIVTRNGVTVEFELNPDDEVIMEYR